MAHALSDRAVSSNDSERNGTVRDDRRQTVGTPMLRFAHGELEPVIDTMALEEPLDMFFDGQHVGSTMRTPGADLDLATGALLSSGRLASAEAAACLQHKLSEGAVHSRTVASQGPVMDPLPPRRGAPPMAAALLVTRLVHMRHALEERQALFHRTGATHCAMFFDEAGTPISFGEDVGRHNAFDKCLGSAVRSRVYPQAHYGVISSRLSHEIVSKAVRTNLVVLAGFSVATSKAVELARAHGITLVGRLRETTMNIYPHDAA